MAKTVHEEEILRFLKFCSVGISGVVVNVGILWLLTSQAGFHYLISSALAIEASILSNFFLNDLWTFTDVGTPYPLIYRLLRMNLAYGAEVGINLSILLALTEGFHIYYLASNLVGIAYATLFNFTIARRFVWRSCPWSYLWSYQPTTNALTYIAW